MNKEISRRGFITGCGAIGLTLGMTSCNNSTQNNQHNKTQKLFLGNFITVDDIKPKAEAVLTEGNIIKYVGDEETARKLSDENVVVFRQYVHRICIVA